MANALILHHYDFSNFSEKVRLVLGLKRLAWDSVEIPATHPKPDYTPLTGGYRRTPALQIDADVYCDTRLIANLLEERQPMPSLFPGDASRARALTEAVSPWAESQLLWPLAIYVTGINAERFPASFHRDRAILHGKAPPSLDQVRRAARKNLDQLRPQLVWIDGLLAGDRGFVLGDAPGLIDFVVYHPLFLLEKIGGAPALAELSARVRAWMARVAAIGAGDAHEITAAEALARARRATPLPCAPTVVAAGDVAVGDRVSVSPLDDSSAPSVGELLAADTQRISVRHQNEHVGEVAVHFPRVGYRLRRIDS